MPKHFGDAMAKTVSQGRVLLTASGWTLLSANGTSNLAGRRHVRIQVQGKVGNTVAVAYANGSTTDSVTYTFTTPTDNIKTCTHFRGTATWVEPLSDAVQIYGRLHNKAAATEGSVHCIVTEYK